MPKYIVTRVQRFTQEVEADTPENTKDAWEDRKSSVETLKETARLIKGKGLPRKKQGTWADEFIEQYNQMGEVSFIDERDRIIDDVKVCLSDISPKGKIVKVWTLLSEAQGKGHGSKVLDKLVTLADKTGTSIILKPGFFGLVKGMPLEELREWYKRHGFKEAQNGWLIYTPKNVKLKVNPARYMPMGYWRKSKKLKSKSQVSRVR